MEINSYLQFLSHEKRYSFHTVTAYKTDLEQFERFSKDTYGLSSLLEADHTIIRSWLVHLMDGLDSRSVRRKITTIKTFYRFLISEGKISHNPAVKVQVPKTSAKIPVFLHQDKLNQYLDSLQGSESFNETRDLLLLEMLYCTGIRLSELLNIRDSDVDMYNSAIKVLGKRNKERIVPFSLQMKALLNRYFELKKTIRENEERFLLVSDTGKQLYSRKVYDIVNKHLGNITTQKKKSPHVLRHTFATDLLNNGADINAIKELLGHSSLAATQIYTHNNIDKLKNIYKQAHPRA